MQLEFVTKSDSLYGKSKEGLSCELLEEKRIVKNIKILRRGLFSAALIGTVVSAALGAEMVALGGEGAVIICPYLPVELTEVPLCNGKKATCVGTDGHDIVWGTDGPDVIFVGAGNDIVQADEGDDTVCGGPGNDALHGARGNDQLFGDDGSDWLFGAPENDALWGGPGDFDVLWGGPGVDRLDGGPGANDACLLQRDAGFVNKETCEAIHPPENYTHDEAGGMGPGIIGPR